MKGELTVGWWVTDTPPTTAFELGCGKYTAKDTAAHAAVSPLVSTVRNTIRVSSALSALDSNCAATFLALYKNASRRSAIAASSSALAMSHIDTAALS